MLQYKYVPIRQHLEANERICDNVGGGDLISLGKLHSKLQVHFQQPKHSKLF